MPCRPRTTVETLAERALQRFGLHYLANHRIGRYSIDFALPSLGVALECDGPEHSSPPMRDRDIRHNAIVTAHGWRVVRMSNRALRQDAAAAVAAALNLPLP